MIEQEIHLENVFNRNLKCFKNRPQNIWKFIEESIISHTKKTCIIDENKNYSYSQILKLVSSLETFFLKYNFKKKDRIGILFENDVNFVIVSLYCLRRGLILVPLNPRSSKFENNNILNDCNASAVIFHPSLSNKVSNLEKVKIKVSFKLEDLNNYSTKDFSEKTNLIDTETAIILYTSGTTGKPKGAMLTHFNVIHSCLHYKNAFNLTSNDHSILVVPASHVTGIVAHFLLMIFVGGSLTLKKKFEVKDFLNSAEDHGLTYLIMVPAMYNLCIERGEFNSSRLSKWRIGGFGGAPMPIGTLKKLKKDLPNLSLINIYGATETTSPTTIMPNEYSIDKLNSVGKCVPTGQIKIINEKHEELESNQHGELWILGPMVIPGYWNNDIATKKEFTENGFWKSGDIGFKDEEGYIYILDRKKDVINRAGYNVYSSEIENLLSLQNGVIEVAVIPHPDKVLGEKIHVVIFKNDTLLVDHLKLICKTKLADYKQPDYWTVIKDYLPKNKNGKVMKKDLSKLYNLF